ncbi:DUF2470 domain-containing protein [Microbacterium sp. BK668]|uniref:DUF2470 domain-containing protein n=1 Tax=Microbacterium sp. BK668 TaxID=2512118 RepID=UPI00105BBA81|nr:DUF2470 domain-containing protein [Microbacterium sp. BK668]TDN91130.1 uncharacterized protein DUF2470 [Microbacterium sp. BK668]
MTFRFDDAVVAGVLRHMNGDHSGDSLLIARAFGPRRDYTAATMAGFDGDGGEWLAQRGDGGTEAVRVPWPHGPIAERPQVRREIVALYDAACARLGVEPRPHS